MSLTLLAVFGGFVLCLIGSLVYLGGNWLGGAFMLGLGLIVVALLCGFVEKLFDLFAGIFGGIFGD